MKWNSWLRLRATCGLSSGVSPNSSFTRRARSYSRRESRFDARHAA
jgi:hypothetical protein